MRYIFLILFFWAELAGAQVYTVNSSNDVDDGMCDGVHCSFREAINAAESDAGPSTIIFNIPGAGTMTISPASPFPTVTQGDLTILGETQPGGPGSIVIDFNFRNFMGISFWDILGDRFYISGIDFTDYFFDSGNDHLFQFGDLTNNSQSSRIYNCAFVQDQNLIPPPTVRELINVFRADDLSITNCIFGSDRTLTQIFNLKGYISVKGNQAAGNVRIDSNIFANKEYAIQFSGGTLSINKNIFGALDTSKFLNFLNPIVGILGIVHDHPVTITDNFFLGYTTAAISINAGNNLLINKNRFHNNLIDIELAGAGNNVSLIVDNFGRNGKQFLHSNGIDEIYVERNNISLYDYVFINENEPRNKVIRHIDNRMNCINTQVIQMDPALFPSHPIPTISTVNRNQITGTGRANDSVVVYANRRIGCPNAVCQAGFELGRTRADAAGNWVLNAAYPNQNTISAYQFDSNPNQRPTLYSEFSPCYQCLGTVRIDFNASVCPGQTITYRSEVYSETNRYDSIIAKGDNVSICDSLFVVNITVNSGYRSHLDLSLCYQDTLTFGLPGNEVLIHKDHLVDSVVLTTAFGCDSVTTLSAKEVGVDTFSQTICDNASVTVFGTRFDKNNTSGIAVGVDSAVAGCDSIVFVNLTINNFTEFFLNRIMCPGQNVTVGSEVFNESRLTGDVTLTSSTNCDSIVHVSLTYPDNTGTFSANVCQGDTANILGEDFYVGRTTSVIKRTSSFGCDSFITVTVNIIPNAMSTYKVEICRDDTITVEGEMFFSGKVKGSITLNNRAANGCDSIIDVEISFRPDAIGNFDTTMCENQTRTIYGETFSVTRFKEDIRIDDVAAQGCDSFIKVNIKFVPAVSGTFRPVICRNGTVDVHGQTFSASNPTGSITLPGGSAFGCDSIINVQVVINPPIFADLQTTELICNQANTGELTLTDIRGGSGNFKISIDGGTQVNYSPGISIGDLSSGSHAIRIIDQLGCDTTYNFTINNSQVLDLRMPNDTTIKKGNFVDISARINFNATKIIWDPSTYLACDTCLTTVSTPDNTIKYTLTLTDEKGCIISGSFTINVIVDIADIYVPNVFSPNGDDINDDFKPVFKIPEKTKILIFKIFDRWGNLIYERANGAFEETFGWDGTVDQEKMNPGVYTYIIQFVGEDGQAKWKLGDVTLIR